MNTENGTYDTSAMSTGTYAVKAYSAAEQTYPFLRNKLSWEGQDFYMNGVHVVKIIDPDVPPSCGSYLVLAYEDVYETTVLDTSTTSMTITYSNHMHVQVEPALSIGYSPKVSITLPPGAIGYHVYSNSGALLQTETFQEVVTKQKKFVDIKFEDLIVPLTLDALQKGKTYKVEFTEASPYYWSKAQVLEGQILKFLSVPGELDCEEYLDEPLAVLISSFIVEDPESVEKPFNLQGTMIPAKYLK